MLILLFTQLKSKQKLDQDLLNTALEILLKGSKEFKEFEMRLLLRTLAKMYTLKEVYLDSQSKVLKLHQKGKQVNIR